MPSLHSIAPSVEYSVPITKLNAHAYRISTESSEEDGTIAWNGTVLVVATVEAGGIKGLGYTYCSAACVNIIQETLKAAIYKRNAFDIASCWQAMYMSVRNIGRSGVAACAISAVDNALWDLKAKLLKVPLIVLLGGVHKQVPVYGSGGFTTYGPDRIREEMEAWKEQGIWQFKIKIGRNNTQDVERVRAAYALLPPHGSLFVDANGAYQPKEALWHARNMEQYGVAWFEEPVSSDDIVGLRFVREHGPACMDITAGEYGYNADDFRRLLECKAVDVIQADATRCLGITGFLQAAALADAYHRPLSSHCAPGLHVPLMCHIGKGIHIEYFSDHARIEHMLFDGVPEVENGMLAPQTDRPGFGFVFKEKDAERFVL